MGLIHEITLPMQEVELTMQGGLMHERGGVITGFYGISNKSEYNNSKVYYRNYCLCCGSGE